MLLYYDFTGSLVKKFNKIMVMDALTGEQDRHFENWGIYSVNDSDYHLLPMYDNFCSLLHLFRDNEALVKQMAKKGLQKYASDSKCKVSIDGELYSHFDFINYLINNLEDELKNELVLDIKKLDLLTRDKIEEFVNDVPDVFCSFEHKKLIIDYIVYRKEIIREMVG